MSCTKDLECIKRFLNYPQSLLRMTHKMFGYNRKISLDDKEFIDMITEFYELNKANIRDFIRLWNNAPKYCCLPDSLRKGKCVVYPNQCNEKGIQGNRRVRDVTIDELLDIKKKNNLIPEYAECLYNKDCPRNGKKKSWRDKEKDVCIDYKCSFKDKPNWKSPAQRKRFRLTKK